MSVRKFWTAVAALSVMTVVSVGFMLLLALDVARS